MKRLWWWVDRHLRPHRYWTQAELDQAAVEAKETRRELAWHDDDAPEEMPLGLEPTGYTRRRHHG